jgi:CRISPR-associated protein Cmr6
MSGFNNSLLYFKKYYEGINWNADSDNETNKKRFEEKNKELFGAVFPSESPLHYPAGFEIIDLKTTYPGLLLGSGIAHGSGLLGELKLGFFLDYTTGLPVIPGSSVKGVLRSAFPQGYRKAASKMKGDEEEKKLLKEKAGQTLEYLQFILEEITGEKWPENAVEELETFLFGSYETGKSAVSMSGRPVFHDAIPLDARRVKINGKHTGNYLGDDYITPHNKGKAGIPAALRNPVPIGFLKVLPGVVFRFQFSLRDFQLKEDNKKLEKEQIRLLFQRILLDFGIGAKTNTGYGRLAEPGKPPPPESGRAGYGDKQEQKRQPDPLTPRPPKSRPEDEFPGEHRYRKALQDGQQITGKVAVSKKSGKKMVAFMLDGVIDKKECDGLDDFDEGQWVRVTVEASSTGGIRKLSDPAPA